MSDSCKFIINFLNCGYELFENEKDGDKIINRRHELMELGKCERFFPLIVVPDDVLAETLELALEDANAENTPQGVAEFRETILREAKKVDARTFLGKRLAEYVVMHSGMDILGEFKPCKPNNSFSTHGKKLPSEILIAKIPAEYPWELAAWLPMGGFNDCPSPAEQAAVFKYWNEKYGAVLGAVTYDNLEMELAKPPVTDEEAEALAKEHFAFCYDVVMQASSGWDTIRARASMLKNSTMWYFWWD